jgi:hypothetical protein
MPPGGFDNPVEDRDMGTNAHFKHLTFAAAAFAVASCGSSSNQPPARTAEQCTKMAARTGVAGAKTGVRTGVEGVKAVGNTVGGFVEGGTDKAREKWQEGKAETKDAAHSGAEEVKRESKAPDCP